MLNGIAGLAERADLLDRSVILEQDKLDEDTTIPEEHLMPAFDAARPRLLGALLDAVACGLARLPDVTLDRYPRMADFARWAVACEPALDLADGAFLAAYRRNRAAAQETAMEASPTAVAVRRHVTERGEFHGTAAELLAAITPQDRDERHQLPKTWPANAHGMAAALKRDAPTLRAAGITVEPPAPNARPRRWRLGTGANDGNDGKRGTQAQHGFQARHSPDDPRHSPDGPRENDGETSGSNPLAQTGSVDPVVFDDPASTQSGAPSTSDPDADAAEQEGLT